MYQKSKQKRNAPTDLFTTDNDELLNDKEINVIVKVIDDPNAAFDACASIPVIRNLEEYGSRGYYLIFTDI